MHTYETGATRDINDSKLDFEGILSPLVLERYGKYMLKHSIQADGVRRESDNWQKGIPLSSYMKSCLRHMVEWWKIHRNPMLNGEGPNELEDILCAVMFNVMGYLHETLKKRYYSHIPEASHDRKSN